MLTIEKIKTEIAEAQALVGVYTKIGETYMAIGKRDLAYAKRAEAIAQASRIRNLEALLKAKGH